MQTMLSVLVLVAGYSQLSLTNGYMKNGHFKSLPVNDTEYVPVTWYRSERGSIDPFTIDEISIVPCDSASANNNQIKLTLIVPGNPGTTQKTSGGNDWLAAEISSCRNDFSNTNGCGIATNYKYNTETDNYDVAYSEIVWNIDTNSTNASSIFYIRFTNMGSGNFEYTFQITYVTGETPSDGEYYADCFPDASASAVTVSQYVKSSQVFKVGYKEFHYVLFEFCTSSTTTNYDITATVTSIQNATFSAFSLYACPYSNTNCNANSGRDHSNLGATSVVGLQLTSADFPDGGVILIVVGEGSEIDGQNYFTLTAVLDEQ